MEKKKSHQGAEALSAPAWALREATGWLHAPKALNENVIFFSTFLEGHLAKTSLPSVYLMKYFSALWLRLWWDLSQGLCPEKKVKRMN